LKIETTPLDDHQVKIVAEFENDQLERFKRQAARKISQETKIPGFRPGKAPYDVIRRSIGEKAIVNEAIELMIDDVYPHVIEEASIKPFGPGNLEEIVSFDPPKFAFVIPLEPEITLGDYRSIRLEYSPKPFDEQEVDKFFYQLRTNYGTVEPAERPAQENDQIFLTYSGTLVHPAEGEDTAVIPETPYQQIIKPEDQIQENETPFPGFSRSLIGSSAGDERDFTYIYPENEANEKIRGKEVIFHVKVQSVKSLILPELDDEFAQNIGGFPSFEEMRNSMRTRLEANTKEEYDQSYFAQIVDKILETATLKYPPQALEEEIEQVIRSIEKDLANQKLDLETYLKLRKTEKEAFIQNEAKPIAIKRLERSLIMDEVSKLENIKVDQKQLETSFNSTLSQLQVSGELPKMRKRFGDDRLANMVAMETASRLLNRQVLDRLKAIVTGQNIEEAPVEAEIAETIQVAEPVSKLVPPEANSPENEVVSE
jgi:trigger factor